MIRNYLKIAIRNLIRHKAFSIINIAGLAVSIAACLLLYMIVVYETGYDTFQPNYKRIARVVAEDKRASDLSYTPGSPFPLIDAMRADFPTVQSGAICSSYSSQITVMNNGRADQKYIEIGKVYFAEPGFFKVFDYQWLAGSADVLATPNTVVLTKTLAAKYFHDWKNAIGKFIKMDNTLNLQVSAIIDDPSAHSDFPMGAIVSFITMKNYPDAYQYRNDWNSVTSNFQVYLLLPKGLDTDGFGKTMNARFQKYYGKNILSQSTHMLQPLSEIHFDKRFSNFSYSTTSHSKLVTLSLIGFLIIIMAAINFINLSTAKAVTRSREIGVRKVLGSSRKQLFWQMMGETGVVVFISTALALGITLLVMPYLKYIITLPEELHVFRIDTLLFTLLGFILVTFLAGIYPSLILSGFTPIMALKNKITSATVGGISLRRGLVVTQFAISQMLIIGTIVAVSQMDFVNTADLGFNKDGVMILNHNSDSLLLSRLPAFKQKLLQLPGIESVSFSSDVPSSDNNWGSNFAFDHRPDEQFSIFYKFADADFFKTYGMKFLAGRPFMQTDTINEVVVNQTLLKKLNIRDPQTAIGKQIHVSSKRQPWRTVVGVVQDFKTNSLRDDIKPLFMACRNKFYNTTSIKLHTANVHQTEKQVLAIWDKYFPEYANTNTFMADNIASFYQQENQLSMVYKLFAGLAIFISCLGLYGLVSFMAVQRTKEVGIRKVLGASVGHIVYLFSKEFTLLICVAFVIAAPLAFYFMHNWLNSFTFRINIGVGFFVIAIVTSIVVAWVTVGFQAVKAALANPVKSLKNE